jgi:hypothetical protein
MVVLNFNNSAILAHLLIINLGRSSVFKVQCSGLRIGGVMEYWNDGAADSLCVGKFLVVSSFLNYFNK